MFFSDKEGQVVPELGSPEYDLVIERVRKFWDEFVYDDVTATDKMPGTMEFYDDLEAYRFRRIDYLNRIFDFSAYKGKKILDVGCRIGIDLARFAENGAHVTGIDLSESCIETARRYFAAKKLEGDFQVMNGENMIFNDESFDLVYSHGVVQYTVNPERMVKEIQRVLHDGGEAVLMAYNRYSWLSLLSKISGKGLAHEEAPFFKPYSIKQFYKMLNDSFSDAKIYIERFPVRTGLHKGFVASMYYMIFVGAFDYLPSSWVQKFGAHLIARLRK